MPVLSLSLQLSMLSLEAAARVVKLVMFCYDSYSMEKEPEIQIATRVGKSVYLKIQERQKEAKALTGIKPSISAVARALLEEATGKKR